MSRGPGQLQRWLFIFIKAHPLITFAEILAHDDDGTELAPHFIRSTRRALRKMTDDRAITAVGGGGPRDPYRYYINPTIAAMSSNEGEFEDLFKVLADAGIDLPAADA
jgi:hypothetical protein